MRLPLLVAAAVAAAVISPAHAAATPPDGFTCQWSTLHVDDDGWTGYLIGGPVTASGATVSVRCSIHAGNLSHDGPAVAAVSSGPSTVAVVAQQVTYQAPRDVPQTLCTEATVDGTGGSGPARSGAPTRARSVLRPVRSSPRFRSR